MATPVFARLRGAEDAAAIREGFGRTMRLMVLAMLPLAAGIVAVGPAFLEMIYGDEYADVGPVLVILAAGLPLSAVSVASTSLLAGLEDAEDAADRRAVAAVVNVALAFALIPDLDAVGAALANVGGQLAARRVVIPAVRAAGRPRVALGHARARDPRRRRLGRRGARRSSSWSAASRGSSLGDPGRRRRVRGAGRRAPGPVARRRRVGRRAPSATGSAAASEPCCAGPAGTAGRSEPQSGRASMASKASRRNSASAGRFDERAGLSSGAQPAAVAGAEAAVVDLAIDAARARRPKIGVDLAARAGRSVQSSIHSQLLGRPLPRPGARP